LRTLIISDQQLVAEALRMMLTAERPDMTVTWKVSPPLGLGACVNGDPFDLIIVDIDTMGARRLQLAKKVLFLQRTAEVVTVTGLPMPDEQKDAESIGVAAYLSKATPNANLMAALRAHFKP